MTHVPGARGVPARHLVGAAWGAAISLAQLLPGWAFITQSQRSNEGYSFFGSGSLAVKWTALLFDQELFGGNGVPVTEVLRRVQPRRGDRVRGADRPRGGDLRVLRPTHATGLAGTNRTFIVFAVQGVVGLSPRGALHAARPPLPPAPAVRQDPTAESQHRRRGPRRGGAHRPGSSTRSSRRRRREASLVGGGRAVTLAPAVGCRWVIASVGVDLADVLRASGSGVRRHLSTWP